MKINKFIKLKDGIYKIQLEDKKEYKIHEDLILKYNLLVNKDLEKDFLISLQIENQKYEVYNIAIKYLKTKLRSIKEIKEYLKNKEIDELNIEKTIDLLIKQGYLNDKNYAKALINDRIRMSSYGPNKIIRELENNGISEEVITENIIIFNEELQGERIIKIIEKQLKINRNKNGNVLKRKIEMYLFNLGYDNYLINKNLSKINFNNKDLYKKEYDKAYKILSKKYNGSELEYKVKQRLYQKGFINDDK